MRHVVVLVAKNPAPRGAPCTFIQASYLEVKLPFNSARMSLQLDATGKRLALPLPLL